MNNGIILANAKKYGMGPIWLNLDDIEATRFHPIRSKIQEYKKLKTNPPEIVVSGNKPPYKILDGHHRYIVALENGETEIEAYIYNR